MDRSAHPAPPIGFPVPLTRLIGRERELTDLHTIMRSGDVRLLTLVGAGGVGKTRLALAAATHFAGHFPGGVHFVGLGTLALPDLVPPKIAQDLRIRESRDLPLSAQLAERFRDDPALIVLDCMERLIEAGAFLNDWLRGCPAITCLVTSRRVLNISAEHIFAVSPLEQPPPGEGALEEIGEAEAVQLFLARSRAVSPGFAITPENAAAIAEICRRLEGLPLAIELAAARVRHFPLEMLLARLDEPLSLLKGGPSDAPQRHQSLVDTILWSYDLLDDDERRLLRWLAVLRGGFTPATVLEAAAAAGLDAAGALDTLASLADQSLLHLTESEAPGTRYHMLDTVREFALGRLAMEGEEERARGWHRSWCLDLITASEAVLGTARQRDVLRQLETEYENVRGALRYSAQQGDRAMLARLAASMWRFWYARGYLTEGRYWLTEALAAEETLPPPVRVTATLGMGALTHAQGDEELAAGLMGRALALARSHDDPQSLAMVLHLLGVIARDQGDLRRALGLFEESVRLFRAAENTWGLNLSLNALTGVLELCGEDERAAEVLGESIELARTQGDQWALARGLVNLAQLAQDRGDLERAAASLEESARLFREVRDRRGEADALTMLGRVTEARGDLDRAISLHQQSLAAMRSFGDRRGEARTLANLGQTHLSRGDVALATEAGRESLALRQAIGDQEGIAESLELLAVAALERQRPDRSVLLWAGAAAIRDAIGAPLSPFERTSYDAVVTRARALLTPDRMTELWARGRGASRDDLIAFALTDEAELHGEVPPPRPPAIVIGLSSREYEVLRLLDEHSDREIAEILFISRTTVSTHVTSILNKLGVNTRTAAVAHAIRQGLI
jgi:predicted ATPase/DNA-binding CsgD family transcriptional regulator